jgi:hypothetical protein
MTQFYYIGEQMYGLNNEFLTLSIQPKQRASSTASDRVMVGLPEGAGMEGRAP